MAQAAWADKASTWSADTFLWANTTYEDVATLASDVSTVNTANTIYPSGIILASSNAFTGSGGFNLVGHANFDLSSGITNTGNTIFVNAIELNGEAGLDSVGNMPITGSITLASGVYIQQSDLSVWSTTSETWAASTDTWNYGATVAIPVSANLAQINLSELHEEDAEKIASALYAMATGATASGSIIVPASVTFDTTGDFNNTALALMPMSVTLDGDTTMTDAGLAEMPMSIALDSSNTVTDSALALMPMSVVLSSSDTLVAGGNTIYISSIVMSNEQNIKFNINFEESAGFAMASNTASINNFLWNDQEEDTATAWTKVADPDA